MRVLIIRCMRRRTWQRIFRVGIGSSPPSAEPSVSIHDPTATNYAQRFYRVLIGPEGFWLFLNGQDVMKVHKTLTVLISAGLGMAFYGRAENPAAVFPSDPKQILERTCFQTGEPWSDKGDLRVGCRAGLRH